MQQRAWLAATPAKKKKSRGVEIEAREGKDSPRLEMPDLGSAAYLAGYLFEAGPTVGEHPLTWGELNEWQAATGAELDEFEAGALVQLSRAYLGMLHEAREADCIAPYESEESRASRRKQASGAPWRQGPGTQRKKQ